MCKERKYASYKVVVTRNNGEKEEISFEGVTGSDFKAMREAYSDYKEKVTPDSNIINIDFCGVSKDGKMNVMCNKPYEKKEESKISYLNTDNPIEAILENLEYLKSIHSSVNDIVKFYDGNDIPKLHMIENISNDEDMKDAIKTIKLERDERRIAKNKKLSIDSLIVGKTFDKLLDEFKHANKLWIGDSNNFYAKRQYLINNFNHRVKYNNEEERDLLMRTIKEDGWKDVVDLMNGYIAYRGNILHVENFKYNIEDIKNRINKNDTTKGKDCIPTISINNKVPKTKGSNIKIHYNTDKEKMHIIKTLSSKYERCETLSEKNIVRLMNRIA